MCANKIMQHLLNKSHKLKAQYVRTYLLSPSLLSLSLSLQCTFPLSKMDYYAMNERWELSQVRAVFSRRYLHQNKALEIFFTDRCTPTHTHLEYMYQFYCVLLRLHFFNILEGQLNTQKSDSHYVTFLCMCVCVCVQPQRSWCSQVLVR